ncbi:MAG: AAA family ATPase [Planctomycetota bacterium]
MKFGKTGAPGGDDQSRGDDRADPTDGIVLLSYASLKIEFRNMLHAYWGLNRLPFAVDGVPPLFHEGEPQVEALARLRYAVDNRLQATLVFGDRGAGKSTLLEKFARQCRQRGVETARLNLAGISRREALWLAACQLAINPRGDDDAMRIMERFAHRAAAAELLQTHAVLLVDDVDLGGPDVLTQLRRVAQLGGANSRWLTLVLAVDAAAVDRLDRAIFDVSELTVDVDAWEEPDAVEYVQLAMFEAGCEQPVFEEHALSILYTLSGGLPREVNRLANYALLGAAAEGRRSIDAGVIESACDALKPKAQI